MPVQDFGNRSNIVFLTACAAGRKKILAKEDIHALLAECWIKASDWIVGHYVILPDHLHLFCAPNRFEPRSIQNWVAFWKSLASRRWPRPEEQPVWQIDCWDRQLRSGDSYSAKWAYVRENPIRHGLCKQVTDWPYQGELNQLPWHDV